MTKLSFTFNGITKVTSFEKPEELSGKQIDALGDYLRSAFKLPVSSEIKITSELTGPFILAALSEKLAQHPGLNDFVIAKDLESKPRTFHESQKDPFFKESPPEKKCNDNRLSLVNKLAHQNVTARFLYFKREAKLLLLDSINNTLDFEGLFKKTEYEVFEDQPFAAGFEWMAVIMLFINDTIFPVLFNLRECVPERLKFRLLKIIDKSLGKSGNQLILHQSLETEDFNKCKTYCLSFFESHYGKYFDDHEQKLIRRLIKHSPVEVYDYLRKLKSSSQIRLIGKFFFFVIKQSRVRFIQAFKTAADRDISPRSDFYVANTAATKIRTVREDQKAQLTPGLTNILSSESVMPQVTSNSRTNETQSQLIETSEQYIKKNTFPLFNQKNTEAKSDEGKPESNNKIENEMRPSQSLISQKLEPFPPGITVVSGAGSDLTTPHFSPVVPEFQARIESMYQKSKGQTPPLGSHHKNEFFITFNSVEDISKDAGNQQNSRNQDSSLNLATQNEKSGLVPAHQREVLNNPQNQFPIFLDTLVNPNTWSKTQKVAVASQDEISRMINESATINSRPKGAIKIRYPTSTSEKSDKNFVKAISESKAKNSFENFQTIGVTQPIQEPISVGPIIITSPSPVSSQVEVFHPEVIEEVNTEENSTLSPPSKLKPLKSTLSIRGITNADSQMTPPPLPKATSIIPGSCQTISYEHNPSKGKYTESVIGRNNSIMTEKKHPYDSTGVAQEQRVKYLTNPPPGRDNSEISRINNSNINVSQEYSMDNSVLYRPIQDKSGKRSRLVLQTDRESLNNSYNLKLFAVSHRSIFLSNNQDFHNENLNKFYKHQYEEFVSGKYQRQRKNCKEILRQHLKQNPSNNLSPCRTPSVTVDREMSLQNKNQSLRAIDSRCQQMLNDNSSPRRTTDYSELEFQLKPTKVEPYARSRLINQSERSLVRDPSSSPLKDITCNSRINNSDYLHLNDDSRAGSTHDKGLEQNFIKLCEHEVYEINDLSSSMARLPSSDEAQDLKLNIAKSVPLQSINEVLETDLYEEQRLYMSFENILSFLVNMNLMKSTLDTNYFKQMFQANDPIIKSIISVFEKSRILIRKFR